MGGATRDKEEAAARCALCRSNHTFVAAIGACSKFAIRCFAHKSPAILPHRVVLSAFLRTLKHVCRVSSFASFAPAETHSVEVPVSEGER